MPFIKIHQSEYGSNKGSSRDLINYLEKENQQKSDLDKTWFFSHTEDKVPPHQAWQNIDGNVGQLAKNQAKFYMVTINPSAKELEHIANNPEKLKTYTRAVMEEYAKNFNKSLEGKDLVYYAKVEEHRYYKSSDKKVKNGLAAIGEKKPGNNMHVHVVVSRKDVTNSIKLSPLTHHRNTEKGRVQGGFDRVEFKTACEKSFDQLFNYSRAMAEKFEQLNEKANGIDFIEKIFAQLEKVQEMQQKNEQEQGMEFQKKKRRQQRKL